MANRRLEDRARYYEGNSQNIENNWTGEDFPEASYSPWETRDYCDSLVEKQREKRKTRGLFSRIKRYLSNCLSGVSRDR